MTDRNKPDVAAAVADAAAYFRQKPVYRKVFEQMYKKWKKYGRVAGKITLGQLAERDRDILEGFLGRDLAGDKVSFTAAEFEQALLQTKFSRVTLEALLESYFGETLVTNKDVKQKLADQKIQFFTRLQEQTAARYGEQSSAVIWLEQMMTQKKHGYYLLLSEFQVSPQQAGEIADSVCRALERLSHGTGITMRLALLGAEITRNPHTFDRKNTEGKLLIQALACLNENPNVQSGEDIFMLYHKAGLIPDDISSFTTAYGISLYQGEEEHPAYRSFIDGHEPYVVTLSNLSRIDRADCRGKSVYVVENQMVFSHMCSELAGRDTALMCTSGQMKTASLILIDLLCEAGCDIFYAGDFDPEGVTIADRMIRRNPGRIRPWRMAAADYELAVSNETISQTRLMKLALVQDQRLFPVCDAIRERKLAGYQEQLVSVMLADILTAGE